MDDWLCYHNLTYNHILPGVTYNLPVSEKIVLRAYLEQQIKDEEKKRSLL